MKFDVFGMETPCVDLNVVIPEIPERNTGTRVQDLSWQGGGKVSTGVCACARLGGRCTLTGVLGDDLYGRFLYKDFLDHGVDLTGMKVRPGQVTSLDVVVSEKNYQTRSLLFKAGDLEPLKATEVDWDLLLASKVFFLCGIDAVVEEGLRIARKNGILTFIDADYDSEKLREHIPDIDVFVGSEFVFDAMFPGAKEKGLRDLRDELEQVRQQGPSKVVFTFGEKGAVGLDQDRYFHVPAFPVDVVDTVGAGDVFHGAYLAEMLRGRSAYECTVAASAAAAIKCTRIGGRSAIPTRAVMEQFLATGKIDYMEIDQRAAYYRRAMDYV